MSSILKANDCDVTTTKHEDSSTQRRQLREMSEENRGLHYLEHPETGVSFRKDCVDNEQRLLDLLRALRTCPYAERKDRNPRRVLGTCEWFTKHPLYTKWLDDAQEKVLWVSAEPGCGKSVLARYLIDEALTNPKRQVCYFFFKDDFDDQKSSANAVCALLRQLAEVDLRTVSQQLLCHYGEDDSRYLTSFTKLWADFLACARGAPAEEVIIVLDALDECQEKDQRQLISSLYEMYAGKNEILKVKVLVTSRPCSTIRDAFGSWESQPPVIYLGGGNDSEKNAISTEIEIFVEHRLKDLVSRRNLTSEEHEYLLKHFISAPQKTYLWAHLTLQVLEDSPSFFKSEAKIIARSLPSTVDEAYEKILARTPHPVGTRTILNIVLAAKTPFTVEMVSHCMMYISNLDHDGVIAERDLPEDRFEDTVKQLCGSMVIIIDSRVLLLHQTVRQFLLGKARDVIVPLSRGQTELKSTKRFASTWKGAFTMQEAHRQLANWCLQSLWLLPPLTPATSYCGRVYFDSNHNYWCCNWAYHLQNSLVGVESGLIEMAMEACDPSARLFARWYPTQLFMKRLPILSLHRTRLQNLQVQFLLALMLDVDTLAERCFHGQNQSKWQTRDKSRALWWAVIYQRERAVKLLLRHGARPMATYTSLQVDLSTENSLRDRARSYLGCRYSRKSTESERFPVNPVMLGKHSELGHSLHGDHFNEIIGTSGSLLELAARFGNSVIIRMLVEYGASSNKKNREDSMLVFLSNCSGADAKRCKEIHFLLSILRGRKVEKKYMTSMLYSVLSNEAHCKTCFDFVFQKKPPINARPHLGDPILYVAVASDWDCKLVARLIEAGADINATTMQGYSALTAVCVTYRSLDCKNNIEILSLLLQMGADVHARDSRGKTCLHRCSRAELIDTLVADGADINVQDEHGQTPLMELVNQMSQRMDICEDAFRCMLKHGADVSLRNLWNQTATQLAQETRTDKFNDHDREGIHRIIRMLQAAEDESEKR